MSSLLSLTLPLRARGGEEGVHTLNPLEVNDWDEQVQRLPGCTPFHRTSWLSVLRETHQFTPFCIAKCNQEGMTAVLPLVEAKSRFMAQHGVGLPFADLCPPLAQDPQTEQAMLEHAKALGKERQWRCIEWRGTAVLQPPLAMQFYSHVLDLRPGAEELYKKFQGSIRSGIRKSENAGVTARVTTTEEAMDTFHYLYCLTRKRHGVPPQPRSFFRAVHRHLIAKGEGFLVEVKHQGKAVASGLYFVNGKTGLYKNGASDYRAQGIRPNNLMMWTAIKELINRQCDTLHFGRTGMDNDGLRRFKTGWGAAEGRIYYYCFDFERQQFIRRRDHGTGWHIKVFRHCPIRLARLVGALMYKHRT